MASRSLQAPLPRVGKQSRVRAISTPSVRMVVAVVVTLLILFGWLRLILALEVASTGRQLQVLGEDLKEIERDNDYVGMRLAEALDPAVLAARAAEAGFQLSKPDYVPMPPPSAVVLQADPAPATEAEVLSNATQFLLELAAGEIDDLMESESAP
jgi:hypothetical protein